MNLLLKKLYLEGREFVTSEEIKRYCRSLRIDYKRNLRYLLSRNYLVRIFKGIFYLRSMEEVKIGRVRYDILELVAKGLGIKGVENWYFGLYTALKLNNMTHEHFTVDYVINDAIFRARPMGIAGYKFRFLKLKPSLLKFGIKNNKIRYSDAEKTILDFIYVWRYRGTPEERIVMDLSDYTGNLSREKILEYSGHYPKGVGRIVERVIE